MKTAVLVLVLLSTWVLNSSIRAQGPNGNDFGFGIILGEPLGGTVKIWTANDQAVAASIGGNSYFGSLRIGADYLWHFDVFRSQVVKMYAGPGLVLGFGTGREYFFYKYKGNHYYFYERDNDEVGIAMRVVAGLNIVPKRTPIEIFLELGPLIGISPGFGVALDVAAGIRFYP
jgi:hypothetical protein